MNKQELLVDLKAKAWCDSLNGQPELQETKSDGGKWYNQNMREVQSESICVYRNIPFYVVDEGKATEKAYYKDAVPDTITKKIFTFSEKVKVHISKTANSVLEGSDEDGKFAVIKQYVASGEIVSEKRFLLQEINEIMKATEIV